MPEITADRFLKPFGEKAYKFAFRDPKEDRLINLLWGTVRSSKTWAMMVKLIRLLSYKTEPGAHNIIFGVTKQTVKNNVLDDLFTLLGPSNYTFNSQSGNLNLMGDPWLVFGAKDIGSEKYIRGITIGKAVGDEWTLIPPSFLKMVQNRMSVRGARLYGTTNTDTPFHYVKTDILDRLAGTDLLWEEKFTLADNPWNRPGYYEDLCKMYPPGSLYYQRFVLGLWVTGEGAIYKDVWSEELLYDDEPWTMTDGRPGRVCVPFLRNPNDVFERCIPVDCGVDHPQVYLDIIDDGKESWVDREYVWDSHLTNRQKTDREYREDLQLFMSGEPIPNATAYHHKFTSADNAQVIIPPECASFEAELTQSGIWFCEADNEVLDGIKAVSTLMALKRIHFHRRHCPRTIQGLQTHIWDEKAAARGIEQPKKVKDDEADTVRYYCKTKISPWRLCAA
jgi:hypothetical protein